MTTKKRRMNLFVILIGLAIGIPFGLYLLEIGFIGYIPPTPQQGLLMVASPYMFVIGTIIIGIFCYNEWNKGLK